jgi:hypothetical protein
MNPAALASELRHLLTSGVVLPPGRRIPALVLASGVILVALTGVRAVYLLTSRPSDEKTAAAIGAGSASQNETGQATNVQDPFAVELALPRENHPGILVRELAALLRESGVKTYQYRVTRLVGGDSEAESAAHDDWALPPDDQAGEELEIDLESLPEVLGEEAAMTVADLFEWRLALQLEASYASVMSFLSSLQHSGRVWAVPHLSCTKASQGVRTRALLLTWTEAADSGYSELTGTQELAAAPSGSSRIPLEESAPAVKGLRGPGSRDPFHALIDGRSGSVPVPATPHLGAISYGEEPIAWLGGQRVQEGDRLGSWTVVKIAVADVTLRHESGALRRVRGDHDLLPQR